jgi:hypothetical protein
VLRECAERDPGFTRVSLIGLPGLKVIAGCEQIETGLFGVRSELEQLRTGAPREARILLAM